MNIIDEFKVREYSGDRPIIIYGAGVFGEYVLHALYQYNISPSAICDREKAGRQYFGYKVCDYTHIKTLDNPIVLVAVGAAFQNAVDFLKKNGIFNLYSIYNLCFENIDYDMNRLSSQAFDVPYYKKLYRFGMHYRKEDKDLKLFSIDWVITERCSLRCRDCANLMQYYSSPVNFSLDRLKEEMDLLLEVVDEIMDVRVIGGEPFMHPQMSKIMEDYLPCDKINNFSVYTNATILPSLEMLEILRNKKVKCEISNYGALASNYEKFVLLMKQNRVRYHVVEMDEWHKLGPLKNRGYTVEKMKNTFSQCCCNDLITLLEGKIYRCPYSAHGRQLKAIPYHDDDIVDLYSNTVAENKKKLKSLLFLKEFDYACGYCSGRNLQQGTVPPAIQVSRPLTYRKINE